MIPFLTIGVNGHAFSKQLHFLLNFLMLICCPISKYLVIEIFFDNFTYEVYLGANMLKIRSFFVIQNGQNWVDFFVYEWNISVLWVNVCEQ